MKPKTTAFLFGIITLSLFLTAYFFIRPRLYEHEYISRISSQSKELMKKIEQYDPTREFSQKDYRKFFEAANKIHGPFEYCAIFDSLNANIYSFSLDRESELFYSITQDISAGKLKAEEKPLVRYYNEKKFYIIIKHIPGGTCALSYRFEPTRRDIIRLSLEIILIVLMSIFFAATFHIYRYRSGKVAAEVHRVVKVGKDSKSLIPDLDDKRREFSSCTAGRLKSYVYELFTAIASTHAPDIISIYIMNRESTGMSKTFEMKGKSFISIDSPDLDVIHIQNEIGRELQRSSVLVLSNGTRLLIPIMYRNTLLGAVNLYRGVPFQGMEIKDIRSSFGKLAQFLSEYIVYHDAVVDSATGLYTNFFFNMKYDELLSLIERGGRFSVLEIALTREGLAQNDVVDITKAIAPKLLKLIGISGVASLSDSTLRVLLPDTDKDSAIQTAQILLSSLSKLAVKTEKGKITLSPVIGLASTTMPDCAENPLEVAHTNMEFALRSGESPLEYSRIKSM